MPLLTAVVVLLGAFNAYAMVSDLTPVLLDPSGTRILDTTNTLNTLISDLELRIELGPFNIDCDRFRIGSLSFDVSEVTEVEGKERILTEVNVDDFEARCRVAALRFTSDNTKVNFKLEFLSDEIGRVVPFKGQVPEDFNCEEEFLDLRLSGIGTGAIEDQIPELACTELEPLFQNLTALLSESALIQFSSERPAVSPDVVTSLPSIESELASTIPSGFEFHDNEKLDALFEQWGDSISETVFVQTLKEQINNVIAAIQSGDPLNLVFALETLIFVLVGLQVPIPESIAVAILEIDFSNGLGGVLEGLLENLDIGTIISFVLELLGIDFDLPFPDDVTPLLEANPMAKLFFDEIGLTQAIFDTLDFLKNSENENNIIRTTTVQQALFDSSETKLTSFLKNFPSNEKLSIALSQLLDIPVVNFLTIFTAFSQEEINFIVGDKPSRNIKDIIDENFRFIFPQNSVEAFNSLKYVSRQLESKEMIDLLNNVNIVQDKLSINFTLGDLGTFFITLEDFGFDFDVALDGEFTGFSLESSLVFPKLVMNNVGISISIGIEVVQGRDTTISDILTISGGMSGSTQEALTLIFSYDDLFAYEFDNAVDLVSALRVIGDLAGCFLSNFGFALSAQSTSFNLAGNLDSQEDFEGFVEDLVNTILSLYLPIVPTIIEKVLAGLVGDSFNIISNFGESCTRQGFVEGESRTEDVKELFTNINDGTFITLAIVGMILMSSYAVFYVLKKDKAKPEASSENVQNFSLEEHTL